MDVIVVLGEQGCFDLAAERYVLEVEKTGEQEWVGYLLGQHGATGIGNLLGCH
jgi:hypothetical protein